MANSWDQLRHAGAYARAWGSEFVRMQNAGRRRQGHVGLGIIHRDNRGSRRVFVVRDVTELLCRFRTVRAGILFADFVADAPQKHRGMIPVAADGAASGGGSASVAGVATGDAVTFLVASALCLLMTLAGSLFPVVRAVNVDPASAFRGE